MGNFSTELVKSRGTKSLISIGYKKSDFDAAIDKLAPLVKIGGIKRGGN
jgi:hypothetical protein